MAKAYSTFEGKKVRKIYINDCWYFCLSDVVHCITNSKDSKLYLKDLRRRKPNIKEKWNLLCPLYPIQTKGGYQKLKCVNYDSLQILFETSRSVKKEKFFKWVRRVSKQKND
ncbi:MAG: hypothetical protein IJ134_04205 [Bacilli bacterium]|nr:hypothetical protein [Bacilli bacterium]